MAQPNMMTSAWSGRSGSQQVAIVVAVAVIATAILFGAYLLLRSSYQTLFTDLRPQDAATIVAELERQKIDYRLADGGATVLVPTPQVHTVRLKVMSKELPLKGAVGFELFNNADLGLTEFAQKVNYQRALQGELARTIMSLDEIESARVHLSMPETGLFRRNGAKARASIALMTKAGQELPPDAVRGIQRLVAAAVPELEAHEVTIINPRGAPMAAGANLGDVVTDRKLELKIELERYYAKKLLQQIESIVGVGNASVSVDATLNFDQVRITQETSAGTARRVSAATARPAELLLASSDATLPGAADDRIRAMSGLEGTRRIEQIVASPGNVKRLNIGVLVNGRLEPALTEQVRQLVIASAGLATERGDSVTVFSRDRFAGAVAVVPVSRTSPPLAMPVIDETSDARTEARRSTGFVLPLVLGLIGVIVVIATLLGFARIQNRRRLLSPEERAAQLDRLRQALAAEKADARA